MGVKAREHRLYYLTTVIEIHSFMIPAPKELTVLWESLLCQHNYNRVTCTKIEVLFMILARPTGGRTNNIWTRRWDSLIEEVTLAVCLQVNRVLVTTRIRKKAKVWRG